MALSVVEVDVVTPGKIVKTLEANVVAIAGVALTGVP